jgi:trk system potassium uptake protein TrkA
MRLAFIGATGLTVKTAHALIEEGHEVVIIERNEDRIKELSEHLDCAFLHGDGSKPDVLKEVDPSRTQILYCITNHDQTNIIASLIGKNIGIPRVVTMIEDEGFLPICEQLGLHDTIVPVRTISKHLAGLAKVEETEEKADK